MSPRQSTMTPTVVSHFAESVRRRPHATAVSLVGGSEAVHTLSYEDLYSAACQAAWALRELGVRKDDRILVAMSTCRESLAIYLAALYTGVIPVLMPKPSGTRAPELHADQLNGLAARTGARCVLLDAQRYDSLTSLLEGRAVDTESFWGHGETQLEPVATPESVAHLQVTSGSTGVPKLAVIRHGNIGANVQAIGMAVGQREGDRVVSWLPLYHDMGLICISYVLYWQCPLVLTDASNFVLNPFKYWLKLISDFGGTISPAPTSAYQVCARLAQRRRFSDLDLSRWRVAFCGAEPVPEDALRSFHAAFAPYGLPATTLLPVYGLAEATLAATIPPANTPPHAESVDGPVLEATGRAVPAPHTCARPLVMVSVGSAIPGTEVRVVADDGHPLGERQVGEIEIAGPSVIDNYWDNESAADLKTPDGYLRTGDLGYLAEGQLYVTGRKKDIIIHYGLNLLPTRIERLVEQVVDNGILGGVAAVGLWKKETSTEEVHLLVESRVVPPADSQALEEKMRAALREAFALSSAHIHWIKKGQLPKTTSGKIQRHRCKELIPDRTGGASRRHLVETESG
jgi:fatty-acyl-CoA synthase